MYLRLLREKLSSASKRVIRKGQDGQHSQAVKGEKEGSSGRS